MTLTVACSKSIDGFLTLEVLHSTAITQLGMFAPRDFSMLMASTVYSVAGRVLIIAGLGVPLLAAIIGCPELPVVLVVNHNRWVYHPKLCGTCGLVTAGSRDCR